MSAARRTRTHRTARRTDRPAPRLLGQRHLAALTGLAHPAELPAAEPALPPPQCVMSPGEVARVLAGDAAVLARVGQAGLLRCEIPVGFGPAAGVGRGTGLPPHVAKALRRFRDAFSDTEPRLRGTREGLRVHALA